MLIFILPSSLYLKITHQDGAKLTQRIWVCVLFRSMCLSYHFLKWARQKTYLISTFAWAASPDFSILLPSAGSLAFPFSLALCVSWGKGPLCSPTLLFRAGDTSFQGSSSSASSRGFGQGMGAPAAALGSPFSPASFPRFSVPVQKAHSTLCLQALRRAELIGPKDGLIYSFLGMISI